MPLMAKGRILFSGALLLLALGVYPAAGAPVVIDRDTVWSGTVEVGDIVAVNAEATLTIRPGTEIRFAGNAAGGSLVVIYGSIIAEGTEGQPIVFRSAAPEPRPGDWRGIYLEETHERESLFRYCRLEHADAALGGVRSAVRVENSILRQNRSAFRGKAGLKGVFLSSDIIDNGTGLELGKGSLARIENCHIAANRGNGIECFGTSP